MIHLPKENTSIHLNESTSIVCEMGKQLTITVSDKPLPKKRVPMPSWTAASDGVKTREFQSYPYEQTLIQLNANEARLFGLILTNYDRNTGYSIVDLSNRTSAEKVELSKGYKGLKKRELVKRVRQKTYLINPCAKIHFTFFEQLYEVWNNTP